MLAQEQQANPHHGAPSNHHEGLDREVLDRSDTASVTYSVQQVIISISNFVGDPYYAPPTAPLGATNLYVFDNAALGIATPPKTSVAITAVWLTSNPADAANLAFFNASVEVVGGTVNLALSSQVTDQRLQARIQINCFTAITSN
jgi:hypothetical protein